jgi:hypothetical protein
MINWTSYPAVLVDWRKKIGDRRPRSPETRIAESHESFGQEAMVVVMADVQGLRDMCSLSSSSMQWHVV